MAARGAIAKQKICEKIAQTFGQDYVGEFDKKIYIWADDGGERVQIALSMTCPKTFIGESAPVVGNDGGMNFEFTTPTSISTNEIAEKELEEVHKLMEALGL